MTSTQGDLAAPRSEPTAGSILTEARALDLLAPGEAAVGEGDLTSTLAAIVDRAVGRKSDAAADAVAMQAGLLLSKLARAGRDGAEQPGGRSLDRTAGPAFDQLKAEYAAKFRAAAIRAPHAGESDFRPEIARAVRLITGASARARYDDVANRTGVPWFAIAAIHYREASLNFLGHLHNGDPLGVKTTDVPANRPAGPWPPIGADGHVITDPATLWRLSAIDALRDFEGNAAGWTVERMCYAFEAYNGFGSRGHGVPSPYLWNWTQFYNDPPTAPAGGFPRDHVFSSSYVSKQAGVVAILRGIAGAVPGGLPFRFEAG